MVSEEASKELLRFKQLNEELEKEFNRLKFGSPENVQDIAQEEEKLTLHAKFDYRYKNANIEIYDLEFDFSWDELYYKIAPYMLG